MLLSACFVDIYEIESILQQPRKIAPRVIPTTNP